MVNRKIDSSNNGSETEGHATRFKGVEDADAEGHAVKPRGVEDADTEGHGARFKP
jgi:hypothetical protein